MDPYKSFDGNSRSADVNTHQCATKPSIGASEDSSMASLIEGMRRLSLGTPAATSAAIASAVVIQVFVKMGEGLTTISRFLISPVGNLVVGGVDFFRKVTLKVLWAQNPVEFQEKSLRNKSTPPLGYDLSAYGKISPSIFPEIRPDFELIIKVQQDDFLKKKETLLKTRAFCSEGLDIAAVPLFFAKMLLERDGSINFDFAHYLERSLHHHDAIFNEVYLTLHKLEADRSLGEKLKLIPIPSKNSPFDLATRAALCIPPDKPLQQQDVRLMCLASLLTLWAQVSLGNCYAISFCSYIKDLSLHHVLDVFMDLACKGSLTRTVGENTYEFPALPFFPPCGEGTLCASEEVTHLLQLPAIQIACELLGCPKGSEKELLERAIQFVSEPETKKWDLTMALQRIGKENSIAREKVDVALSYVYGISHPLLLQLVENSVVSMLFPPFGASIKNTILQRKIFSFGLLSLYRKKAEEFTQDCRRRKCESSFPDICKEFNKICAPGLVKALFVEKESFSASAIDNLCIQVLPLEKECKSRLQNSSFELLSRIRMACVPPSNTKETNLLFLLCEKTDKGFVPLNSERLGNLLQACFINIVCNLVSGVATPSEILSLEKELTQTPFLSPETFLIDFKETTQDLGEALSSQILLFERGEKIYSSIRLENVIGGFRWGSEVPHIFFNREDFSERAFPTDLSQDGIIKALELFREIRERGDMHGTSFLATKNSHAFRILPWHPSLTHVTGETLKEIEKNMVARFQQPVQHTQQWKNIIQYNLIFLLQAPELRQEFDIFLTTLTKQSWKAIYPKILSWLEKNGPPTENMKKLLDEIVFSALATKDTLLYFADNNDVVKIKQDVIKKIYFAYGFNPREKKWNHLTVLEEPDLSLPHVEIEQFQSFTVILPSAKPK